MSSDPAVTSIRRDWRRAFSWKGGSILRSKGLSGSLGLAAQEGIATGGHEMSDGDIRVNKLTFGGQASDDPNYATTSWRVIDDGNGTFATMKCNFCTVTKQRHKCS